MKIASKIVYENRMLYNTIIVICNIFVFVIQKRKDRGKEIAIHFMSLSGQLNKYVFKI